MWWTGDAGDANAHDNLGLAYVHLGRYNDAVGSYKKAIKLHPLDPIAYRGLLRSYLHVNH
jgi:cytochrome c-type biogenesis protein CcmH/NrfG